MSNHCNITSCKYKLMRLSRTGAKVTVSFYAAITAFLACSLQKLGGKEGEGRCEEWDGGGGRGAEGEQKGKGGEEGRRKGKGGGKVRWSGDGGGGGEGRGKEESVGGRGQEGGDWKGTLDIGLT